MKTISQAFSQYLATHCSPDALANRFDGQVQPYLSAFSKSDEAKDYFSGIKLGMVLAENRYLERNAERLIREFAQTKAQPGILSTKEAETVRRKFAADTFRKGQTLKLIGGWSDLAAFYLADNGEVFCFQSLAGYGAGDGFVWLCEAANLPAALNRVRGGLFAPLAV